MFAVLRRLRRRSRVMAVPAVAVQPAAPVRPAAVVEITPIQITPMASAKPANDTKPVSEEPKPVTSPSDQETIERQIASLLAAWDKTSLCARREFLTRIDQRIMTTHWIRTARGELVKGAAAV